MRDLTPIPDPATIGVHGGGFGYEDDEPGVVIHSTTEHGDRTVQARLHGQVINTVRIGSAAWDDPYVQAETLRAQVLICATDAAWHRRRLLDQAAELDEGWAGTPLALNAVPRWIKGHSPQHLGGARERWLAAPDRPPSWVALIEMNGPWPLGAQRDALDVAAQVRARKPQAEALATDLYWVTFDAIVWLRRHDFTAAKIARLLGETRADVDQYVRSITADRAAHLARVEESTWRSYVSRQERPQPDERHGSTPVWRLDTLLKDTDRRGQRGPTRRTAV